MPLIYCLVLDKRELTYKRVFSKMQELRVDLNAVSIMCDFEKAIHNAILCVFFCARIIGHFFHLGQCVWRKVQDLGLAQLYTQNEDVRVKAEMLLALSFMPVDDVISTFEELVDCIPEELIPLADLLGGHLHREAKKATQRCSSVCCVHMECA